MVPIPPQKSVINWSMAMYHLPLMNCQIDAEKSKMVTKTPL